MSGNSIWKGWGARRCSLCSINFPNSVRFHECPVCGEATHYFSNIQIDEEWLQMAVDKVHGWDGEVPDYPPAQDQT